MDRCASAGEEDGELQHLKLSVDAQDVKALECELEEMDIMGQLEKIEEVYQVVGWAWCCTCVLVLVYHVPRLSRFSRELQLIYFQPMVPITFALWLWGHNVQRFHALGIEYELCFRKDRKYLLPSGDIYRIAFFLTIVCLTCAAAFSALAAAGAVGSAELTAVVMYFLSTLLLVAPLDIMAMSSRLFFGQTLQRVLLPFQEVSWADFLMADIMTSLSKSIGDLAKTAAVVVTGPALHALLAADPNGGKQLVSSLAPPVVLAICLPYIIRFVQCIIVNRTTGNRSQLLNAAKYATAFPALILTAFEHVHHVKGEPFELYGWWICAVLLNTLYSFYWDVEMDWDMPWLQPGCTHVLGVVRLPGLKPDALYSRGWYVWALMSNLVLRMSWTYRLMGDLERYKTVALALALLEVFRRYQWTFIRVETELRKLREKSEHDHVIDGLRANHEHQIDGSKQHEVSTRTS